MVFAFNFLVLLIAKVTFGVDDVKILNCFYLLICIKMIFFLSEMFAIKVFQIKEIKDDTAELTLEFS